MNGDAQWHLDKKVPIGIIVAIVIQTVTFVAVLASWKADVENRLTYLERTDAERKPQETRIVVIEQNVKFILDGMRRIEEKLDGQSAVRSPAP